MFVKNNLMFIKKTSFLLLFIIGINLHSQPLQQNSEIGSSISRAYQARSVLVNPAALAFQTKLNGVGFLTAFTYGFTNQIQDEFSLSFGLGYFGFSAEQISSPTGYFSRYSAGIAYPLSHQLFLGSRFSFTKSDTPSLNSFNSIDLGIQYRPFKFASLGLLAKSLNQPTILSTKIPTELGMGLNIRPIDEIDISLDLTTQSDAFAKPLIYQATASYEVIKGLKFNVGYHKNHKFQAGVQLDLNHFSFYSNFQPSSTNHRVMAGTQLTLHPQASFLQPDTAMEVDINEKLQESPSPTGWFRPNHPTLLGLLENLRKAEHRKDVSTVILKIDRFVLGLASAEEINQRLWRLRDQGKKIISYVRSVGLKEYLIASASHKIYMEPDSEFQFVGLKSQRYYLKGPLDKLGIKGELLAKGEYKTAPETFLRKTPSPKSREMTLDLIQNSRKQLLNILKRSKRIDEKKWKQMTRSALMSPDEALKLGLIDGIESYSNQSLLNRTLPTINSAHQNKKELWLKPQIAVVYAEGDILKKKARLMSLSGQSQVTPSSMERRLRRAIADPRIQGIVLRVRSPGGHVLASRQIASIIEKVKEKKPIVASMGDVAASGGYMISAAASKIFAQPLSITGSIGVFLGKANLEKLYQKIDLNKEIISEAPYAGILSEDRGWSLKEREILTKRMNQYYDSFTTFVAKSRKISANEVASAAQGRVWLGMQAKSQKLIDAQGGLFSAIKEAARMANLQSGEYETVALRERASLGSLFSGEGLLASLVGSEELLMGATPQLARYAYWSTQKQPFLYLSTMDSIE